MITRKNKHSFFCVRQLLRAISVVALAILSSCREQPLPFQVDEVHMLTNAKESNDALCRIQMDLDSAVLNGIVIPTKTQTANGYFNFNFKIKNTSGKRQRFLYKLYYQNKTYKFSENHAYANENFYGSWDDNNIIFRITPELDPGAEKIISDSFRIVGNPRNEYVFYGAPPMKQIPSENEIRNMINGMLSDANWIKLIKQKAVENGVSLERQLYVDALWKINEQVQRDSSVNNRWKRNPRTGTYEFSLLVTTEDEFDEIPAWIKDISQKNLEQTFENPFVWFTKMPRGLRATAAVPIKTELQVSAKIDLTKGIYVNPKELQVDAIDRLNARKEYYSSSCGDSTNLYRNAQVELFFHSINRGFQLENIPVIADVTGDNYSRRQYEENAKKYADTSSRVHTFVNSTDCPCRNVTVNKEDGSLTLRNPGNKNGEFKKEHVGVITRVGFTYGKFRAKIKFPELLSKDHVWNGITNAFWLLAQDVNLNWNMRRVCNADIAYIPKQEPDNEGALSRSKKQIAYSEIDFEILKESEFWPRSSYYVSNTSYHTDDSYNDHDIMVTCTNWDMACHQPEYFNIGAMEHRIEGGKYIHHRWNEWYKALTTKVRAPHDELFAAPYYYYEIEWMPEKIVWRIGPEKDKMRTICIMDKNVSAIPNNQMLMIITQEWHNQEWWPTAPFKQNFVPFPKNDIIGKVLELEIE